MHPDRSLPLIMEEDVDARGAPHHPRKHPLTKSAPARQLDGTDCEWKYRGRSESEEDTAHPICSPAGLTAQKDEGFQRFYKAVVSPTHVRVTAGGRIVPNTRGTSSPTAKLAKDRVNGDSRPSSRPVSRDHQENGPYPIPQVPYGAFPPMLPGFPPGMAPAMAPGIVPGHPAFPMIPWPMGHPYGMMPHPHMAHMAGPPLNASSTTPCVSSDRHSDAGTSENPNPVRVSPPEQFDRSRPFYYNGQWIMPQGAMYPHGAMPQAAPFPLGVAGPPMMGQKYGMHPWMQLPAMRPDVHANPHAMPAPTAPVFMGSTNPPASSRGTYPPCITPKTVVLPCTKERLWNKRLLSAWSRCVLQETWR